MRSTRTARRRWAAATGRARQVVCEDVAMQQAVDDLIALLDLEPIEVNIFRGTSPDVDAQRVFGGQVAGQALVAAARTVDADRSVHSLHAYFLRPGDPTVPILYEVDRIRDGRSFTTRRVVAIQHGRAIFNLQASFHIHEEGLRPRGPHAGRRARPRDAARLQASAGSRGPTLLGEWYDRDRPIDTRNVDWSAARPQRPAAAAPAGVAARRRRAARRPGAARLHRDLRIGHDPARHDAAAPRGRRRRARRDHGQPRPRHVVPPTVPGRRVAALRPGQPVGLRRPRHRPAARSSPTTGTWR